MKLNYPTSYPRDFQVEMSSVFDSKILFYFQFWEFKIIQNVYSTSTLVKELKGSFAHFIELSPRPNNVLKGVYIFPFDPPPPKKKENIQMNMNIT